MPAHMRVRLLIECVCLENRRLNGVASASGGGVRSLNACDPIREPGPFGSKPPARFLAGSAPTTFTILVKLCHYFCARSRIRFSCNRLRG